jgi:hypothetical protein
MTLYKIDRWILSLALLLPLVFGVVACGGQSPVRPTSVMLRYEPAVASFSNSAGWNITLTKAELSLEYVRFHEGHSAYAQNLLWPNLFPASWLLPIQEAHAHPGHYESGAVKAELRLNKTLNLLGDTSSSLGVMQAFTGNYGTGELTFGTEGMVALEGKATRDDKVVDFSLQVPLSEQKVEGLNASHTVGSSPASVMLRVHVERWFELVDITTLPGKNGATPTSASSSSVTILRKAVVSNANYSFAWAETALK